MRLFIYPILLFILFSCNSNSTEAKVDWKDSFLSYVSDLAAQKSAYKYSVDSISQLYPAGYSYVKDLNEIGKVKRLINSELQLDSIFYSEILGTYEKWQVKFKDMSNNDPHNAILQKISDSINSTLPRILINTKHLWDEKRDYMSLMITYMDFLIRNNSYIVVDKENISCKNKELTDGLNYLLMNIDKQQRQLQLDVSIFKQEHLKQIQQQLAIINQPDLTEKALQKAKGL